MKVPQTKQFSDETAFVATNYYKATPDADAFGASIAQAQGRIAKSAADVADSVSAYRDSNERITVVDISNKIDDLRGKLLNDKENGYLNLNGSLAAGKSQEYLAKFDEGVKNIMAEYKLFGPYRRAVDGIITSKKNSFKETVNSHDIKQTKIKNTDICNAALENNYNNFLANRNADNAFEKYDVDNNQILKIYAEQTHLGDEKIQLMKTNSRQKALQGAFEQFESDDNESKIREYHKKYQQYFSPDTLSKIQTYITKKDNDKWADAESDRVIAIDDTEKEWAEIQKISDPAKRSTLQSAWANKRSMKEKIEREKFDDESRSTADRIMSLFGTEEEQLNQAYKIEDTRLSDDVARRIRAKHSEAEMLENKRQDEIQKSFWELVAEKERNGEAPTVDDIPADMKGQNYLSAKNYVTNRGKIDADDPDVVSYLTIKQLYSKEDFVKTDLTKYKGLLTKDKYNSFMSAQAKLRNPNDREKTDWEKNKNEMEKAVEAVFRKVVPQTWKKRMKNIPRNTAKEMLKLLVDDYEKNVGKMSEDRIVRLAESFGYEGSTVTVNKKGQGGRTVEDKNLTTINDKLSYLYWHKGAQIIEKVGNHYRAYLSKHGEPDEKALDFIVNSVVKDYNSELIGDVGKKATDLYEGDIVHRNILSISPLPNFSKNATYFKNSQMIDFQRQTGVKLNTVNGAWYRPGAKGTHHNEGGKGYTCAVDISLSEHSPREQEIIINWLTKLPNTKMLGISNESLINKFKSTGKIEDERKWDRNAQKQGRKVDHLNHVHVTFYDDHEIANRSKRMSKYK